MAIMERNAIRSRLRRNVMAELAPLSVDPQLAELLRRLDVGPDTGLVFATGRSVSRPVTYLCNTLAMSVW